MNAIINTLNYFNCFKTKIIETKQEEEVINPILDITNHTPPRRSPRLATLPPRVIIIEDPEPATKKKKVCPKSKNPLATKKKEYVPPTIPQPETRYKSSAIIDFNDRVIKSRELFAKNKVSDEYYTRGSTWKRFIEEKGLQGTTIFEPFFGDGTSREALKGLVNVVGKAGDFWDNIIAPDCPQEYIMTNPPFSFKWLVIQTFLEMKRPFAMIMPFQIFYNSAKNRLDTYAEKYGGRWEKFVTTARENEFWSPEKNKLVRIGCSILVWTF